MECFVQWPHGPEIWNEDLIHLYPRYSGDYTLPEENMLIIQSGSGFFVRFHNDTPEMTTDPASAVRLNPDSANVVAQQLEALGWRAEFVEVRVHRIQYIPIK